MRKNTMDPKPAEQVTVEARQREPAERGRQASCGTRIAERSSFDLHPSHARLARSLDLMDRPRASRQVEATSDTQPISREAVLNALRMARAQGMTAAEIGLAILGRSDERAVHRISAHLAREAKRGLVADEKGRGVKRRLTQKGREVAAQMSSRAHVGCSKQVTTWE